MVERGYPGWGLAVLRGVTGIIFLAHGWSRLYTPEGIVQLANELLVARFPAPPVLAWVVTFVEFLGGMFILVGWLTRWVAGVLFFEMLVALFAVQVGNGFFVYRPEGEWGYEYTLLLLGVLGCMVLAGSGRLAIDEWVVRRRGRAGS